MTKAHQRYYCKQCAGVLAYDVSGWACPNSSCAIAVVHTPMITHLLSSALRAATKSKRQIKREVADLDRRLHRRQPAIVAQHRRDSRCHWCGRTTKLVGLVTDNLLATWDHVYSRVGPLRNEYNKHLKVLACLECNRDRVQIELVLVEIRSHV